MKGIILVALIMLGVSTTINSTTISGWNWDHSMGNYMGTYQAHESWFPIEGSEDWIVVRIRCHPSNKVCFNINGMVLQIADGPLDSPEELLDYEGDPDEYTISGYK